MQGFEAMSQKLELFEPCETKQELAAASSIDQVIHTLVKWKQIKPDALPLKRARSLLLAVEAETMVKNAGCDLRCKRASAETTDVIMNFCIGILTS
jgi:hypothetical protein